MLDLRQLRQFVAVAESEHVGRASEALHMSQSPLSRQIMQLEGLLGLTLFERAKKRLRLTAQGREFLLEARNLLAQAERVEARARRAGRGESGTLAIGYVDAAVHAGILPAALRRFRAQRPEVEVELRALRSAPQIEALLQREIDCGFLHTPPENSDRHLSQARLVGEKMLLAIPADHPLAGRKSVKPKDLDGLPWIDRPRELNPDANDRLLHACMAAGFRPDLRFEATDPATSLGLVAAGVGFAFVQASMRSTVPLRGVVLVEIPWLALSIDIHVVWRREDPNPLVTALIALLKSDFKRTTRRTPRAR
jgi:DNA-binding transcriptional LysR family regulator